MKLIKTLKFRIFFLLSFFIITLCAVSSWLSITTMITSVTDLFVESGFPLVEKVADTIDPEGFKRITQSLDASDPYYVEAQASMLEMKNQYNCIYLYTMVRTPDGQFLYIIDGSTTPDDEENFSTIGTEEDVSTYGPEFLEPFEKGTEYRSSLEYQEGWGWLVTVAVPIKDGTGSVLGIVACDFDGAMLHQQITAYSVKQGIIVLICLVLGFILQMLISRMIFRPVLLVSRPLKEISGGAGNLTMKIPVSTENEITSLAVDFNKFQDKLREIIISVRDAVQSLSLAGHSLKADSEKTNNALTGFVGTVEGIRDLAMRQEMMTGETFHDIAELESRIDSLGKQISSQSASLAESFSAIEEMSANIESVNNTIEKITSQYKSLVSDSDNGKRMQENVSSQIAEIKKHSEGLSEANTLIQGIAEQTNLLAMNAAIEAAHAGESGKGFAVVADEIRKLAATSAEQSSSIKKLLSDIYSLMGSIVVASDASLSSFTGINGKISSINTMVLELHHSMDEQNTGSHDILGAINGIRTTSDAINAEATMIKKDSRSVYLSLEELKRAANEILEKVEQTRDQTDEMKKTVRGFELATEENGKSIGGVSDIVGQFIV